MIKIHCLLVKKSIKGYCFLSGNLFPFIQKFTRIISFKIFSKEQL